MEHQGHVIRARQVSLLLLEYLLMASCLGGRQLTTFAQLC